MSVIEFPNEEKKKMSDEQVLHEIDKMFSEEQIDGVIDLLEEENGPMKAIFSILALPEDQFAILSEQMLNELEKSVNLPEDKLLMVQALNSSGLKVQDLNQYHDKLIESVESALSGTFSRQKIDFVKRYIDITYNALNNTEGIASRIISIPIELCHEDAQIPKYAKLGDAGMDVVAVEDVTIGPGETKLVKTGLKVAIPLGYELQVRPRSGLSLKTPLRVANAPGTIDSGYRDEIGVIVTNIEPHIKEIHFDENGQVVPGSILYGGAYTITKGMRFAQLVLSEKPTALFTPVETVQGIGFDRAGGFGSSGV